MTDSFFFVPPDLDYDPPGHSESELEIQQSSPKMRIEGERALGKEDYNQLLLSLDRWWKTSGKFHHWS